MTLYLTLKDSVNTTVDTDIFCCVSTGLHERPK